MGSGGQVINVTADGYLQSIDQAARDLLEDSGYGLSALSTDITTLITAVQNAEYGLDAIENILTTGNVDIELDAIQVDIGDFSARTNLGTLRAVIGLPDQVGVQPLATVLGAAAGARYVTAGSIGADFATLLDTRLTSARSGYLDELDFDLNARLGTPAGLSLSADILVIDNLVDDLEGRLTALRAGYLDELDFDLNARLGTPAGVSLAADLLTIDNLVDDLESRLTAARAGYLDNINNADLVNVTLANINTEVDNAVNTAIPITPTADSINERVQTLDNNYTGTRAGYIDNLSGGAAALAATALSTAVWTNARGGYLDELAAANIPTDVDTLLTRLTALRAGYLDELDFDLTARLGTPAGASLAADLLTIDNLVDDLEGRLTALRAGYLDELDFDLNARLGTPTGASMAADVITVDTVVDGIQTDLDNATDGLGKIATESSGAASTATISYAIGTLETTLLEVAQTNIYSLLSFWADLNGFTSGRVITARVYGKIDGTNYRKIDEMDFTAGTHYAISLESLLNVNHNVKVTIQINTAEAGAINVPIRYVLSNYT